MQVPLLLWAVGPRVPPWAVEWSMYATTFLAIVVAGGPMNYWRASVVMHGDGLYLFEALRPDAAEAPERGPGKEGGRESAAGPGGKAEGGGPFSGGRRGS